MKLSMKRTWTIALVAVAGLTLAGCESPERRHWVMKANTGTQLGCQLCYDEAVRTLTGPPKHRRYTTERKHHCPGCYSEVSMYEEKGKPMIKCVRCAPEGLACDKCLPPGPPVH